MYELYPCLWDSKSKDYSNKQLRDVAISDLIDKCKATYPSADRNFVTKKIHSFRCGFRRELKKVVVSLKSGVSADSIMFFNFIFYCFQKIIKKCVIHSQIVSEVTLVIRS